MTTKAKGKADDETAAEPAKVEEQAPRCGAPHYLPALAHIHCAEPAQDPDRAPGTPDHQHRHQDGEAIYTW
ncbi:hypothetical protein AB0M68_03620 [Streptomyces sp. NPDC051453]|uniref:hypothetical protein n=1 Tax=Streptomyces sp. NPDC051453 TaxID=3154941 RepID=UPI00343390CB